MLGTYMGKPISERLSKKELLYIIKQLMNQLKEAREQESPEQMLAKKLGVKN